MNRIKVIPFETREQVLQHAQPYLDSVELFLEERDKAVPLLLKAMKHADRSVKHEIMLLLGSFAKQEAAWPLYEMMIDPHESEGSRHDASIQLSVIFPFLKDPQPIIDRLLQDLTREDPLMRLNAAFALGWEGNAQAAIPLIERLYDPDTRVQQNAVNALANLRDDRILNLMLERLEHGSRDQKRAILFNLWRFYSRRNQVVSVYLEYLNHDDDDLRFDALVLLGLVTDAKSHLEVYVRSLSDPDPRIRALALRELAEFGKEDLSPLKGMIEGMLSDPEMGVKRAAMAVLRKL
ncbi:MAG: HEAT repeat domain-containing protein [Deltaproteobacteria bacterium]|nr:HEAT repeat domain-containing protein [Deltaproteobacteria bacterium]